MLVTKKAQSNWQIRSAARADLDLWILWLGAVSFQARAFDGSGTGKDSGGPPSMMFLGRNHRSVGMSRIVRGTLTALALCQAVLHLSCLTISNNYRL